MSTVRRDEDGTFSVIGNRGEVIKAGLSNRQAWRLTDIHDRETLSKREDNAQWSFTKSASGG